MKIGTIAGGAGTATTLQIEWCPEIISFTTATVPTSVIVNVLGDGVVTNLSGPGITALTRMMRVSRAGGATNFVLVLADGLVLDKTTTITITNATADAFDVFAFGEQRATRYWQSLTQSVLSSSGYQFQNFWELALPSFVTADSLDITYVGGFTQRFSPEDLRVNQSYTTFTNNDASDFRISNPTQRIKTVSFIPAASQDVFLVRQRQIGNLVVL